MPTTSEIVEELRLMNTEFKRLGGWSNDASYISNLAEKVLWLADEVMKLEVAIATLKDSGSVSINELLKSVSDKMQSTKEIIDEDVRKKHAKK